MNYAKMEETSDLWKIRLYERFSIHTWSFLKKFLTKKYLLLTLSWRVKKRNTAHGTLYANVTFSGKTPSGDRHWISKSLKEFVVLRLAALIDDVMA